MTGPECLLINKLVSVSKKFTKIITMAIMFVYVYIYIDIERDGDPIEIIFLNVLKSLRLIMEIKIYDRHSSLSINVFNNMYMYVYIYI